MVLIMPITAPEEGLIYSSGNVKLKINEKIIEKGTLYISQGSLSWQGNEMPDGIAIEWKQISVHGVSTSPVKCIYFMLDHKLQWRNVYDGQPAAANGGNGAAPAAMDQEVDNEEDEGNASDDGDDEEDEEEHLTECWLMPDDVNTVDTIFQAMKDCQALHPDPADSVSEESDFMDDDDNDENGDGENGAAGGLDNEAQDGMNNLRISDDKFADADE